MNLDKKLMNLLDSGLSGRFLNTLSESEINVLHEKLSKNKKETKEVETSVSKKFDPKSDAGPLTAALQNKTSWKSVSTDPVTGKITLNTGKEKVKGKKVINDNKIESEQEMTEKFESKAQQKYFWAKCNRSKGKEKAKWCKMAEEFSDKTSKKEYKKMPEKINPEKTVKYKKENKEGAYDKLLANTVANQYMGKLRGPGVLFPEHKDLEKRIGQIIEKKLNPKMTKKDLIKLVSETELAPEKERTKEREKTKTPPKPRPDNPYKPKPGVKPAPKAGRNELPKWLTSDSIGINIK